MHSFKYRGGQGIRKGTFLCVWEICQNGPLDKFNKYDSYLCVLALYVIQMTRIYTLSRLATLFCMICSPEHAWMCWYNAVCIVAIHWRKKQGGWGGRATWNKHPLHSQFKLTQNGCCLRCSSKNFCALCAQQFYSPPLHKHLLTPLQCNIIYNHDCY